MAKSDKKLLETLRDRYKKAVESDQENRRRALEDMEFAHVPGKQWDDNVKAERASRPCLEFNRLRVTCKRVINQMRSQRPAGKVRPTEDADKDTAQALEGLCRNIWHNSDGDSVIDAAAEYQVTAGMGAWRVVTKYSRDDAWDQDVAIEAIHNPFCLYKDPASRDPVGRDAEYWLLTTRMSKSAFEAKYPKAAPSDFEGDDEFDDEEWFDDDSVRVVEYWHREPVMETLLLLSDGRTVKQSAVDEAAVAEWSMQGISVVKSRQVQTHKIKMCIASGDAILERGEWPGSMFPFVQVYGENMVIDGEQLWWGLVRHSRDAQRAYNYSRTLAVEAVAMAPQAKYLVTPAQVNGLQNEWAEAHKKNFPYLPYNVDPQAPGAPVRVGGVDIPAAWIQEVALSGEDIKATSGIFDPSLGAEARETSGVAIRARAVQGEIATYNYMDNLAKGIRRSWEIMLDVIPHIYDTQRNLRVLGVDGSEKYVTVNDGLVDLSRGKYDVSVTVGPSFSTQRQEAAEVYMGMAQANPAVFGVAGDLMFKSMDLPYADQIADRLKVMLPPQIQQMENEDAKQDPQVMMAMAQAQQAMQMVEQHAQALQQAQSEIQAEKSEAEKAKSDVDRAASDLKVQAANLKVAEANIATDVARFEKLVAETQAKMATSEQSVSAEEREVLVQQVDQALQQINAQAEQFMQAAAEMMAQMQQLTATPVVVEKPVNRSVRIRRVNGGLEGTVIDIETGEPLRQVAVQRVGGELVGTVQGA